MLDLVCHNVANTVGSFGGLLGGGEGGQTQVVFWKDISEHQWRAGSSLDGMLPLTRFVPWWISGGWAAVKWNLGVRGGAETSSITVAPLKPVWLLRQHTHEQKKGGGVEGESCMWRPLPHHGPFHYALSSVIISSKQWTQIVVILLHHVYPQLSGTSHKDGRQVLVMDLSLEHLPQVFLEKKNQAGSLSFSRQVRTDKTFISQ